MRMIRIRIRMRIIKIIRIIRRRMDIKMRLMIMKAETNHFTIRGSQKLKKIIPSLIRS